MTNIAYKHRNAIEEVLSQNTFDHQRKAAHRAFVHFDKDSRAVVIAAEMQSGKSGIALALSGLQRQKLNDIAICDRKQLKDTL
jgi:ABC-type dipeptide/oligopeptide/nickel transport system ATPase subunit